jgi:hypothetical protein
VPRVKGSAILFVALAISCASPATTTPSDSLPPLATDLATPRPSVVLPVGAPSFRQILASAKTSEYRIVYKFSATTDQDTVDGEYGCVKESVTPSCVGTTTGSVGLPQDATTVQETIIRSPEKFDGVLVETRQIAGQQAHCYDVRTVDAAAAFTDGRFCYTRAGIPLLQRFKMTGAEYTLEATSVSLSAGQP